MHKNNKGGVSPRPHVGFNVKSQTYFSNWRTNWGAWFA